MPIKTSVVQEVWSNKVVKGCSAFMGMVAVLTVIWQLDTRFAKAGEVAQKMGNLEVRLEQKIIQDRMKAIEERK